MNRNILRVENFHGWGMENFHGCRNQKRRFVVENFHGYNAILTMENFHGFNNYHTYVARMPVAIQRETTGHVTRNTGMEPVGASPVIQAKNRERRIPVILLDNSYAGGGLNA